MANLTDSKNGDTFVFVIPIRNPWDDKVSDYNCIEEVLKKTVESLYSQTYSDTFTVIVCHKVPSWPQKFGDKVTFLNVSHIPIFPPNRNQVKVDKGLKYIIGSLYARTILDPKFIMLMDADDYVNINLASSLINKYESQKTNVDGYLIKKGIHVDLEINPDYTIHYKNAYLVQKFNQSCGTCRIFKTESLIQKIQGIDPEIEAKFSHWPDKAIDSSIDVTCEPVTWLNEATQSNYLNEDSIVNILGRHIKQGQYFNFSPLSIVGAAKGCGHGNHDGPRQGKAHQDKVIKKFPIKKFYEDFGITEDIKQHTAERKSNFWKQLWRS